MNLNDYDNFDTAKKKQKPDKAILSLVAYNLIYCIASYGLFRLTTIGEILRGAALIVMTAVSVIAIIGTARKFRGQKDVPYKNLIWLCLLAPAGTIADWIVHMQ